MMRTAVLTALLALAATPQPAPAQLLVGTYAETATFAGAVRQYDLPTAAAQGFLVQPGGSPPNAALAGTAGLTVGPDNRLYISSQLTNSVLRYDFSTGTLSTFASLSAISANYQPAGLRFGPDGNLYVSRNGGQTAPAGSGTVDRFNGTTGAFIDSAVTGLTQPTGLLFSGNTLLISNFGGGSVNGRDVTAGGTGSTVLVAPGGGGLVAPAGLAVGPDGNLYVADLLAGAVRRYNPTTGAALGSFGEANLANQFPSDLLFDGQGRLLTANLGPSNNPLDNAGSVFAFNAATGAFLSVFAADVPFASQFAVNPVPEPAVVLGVAAAGWWLARRQAPARAISFSRAAGDKNAAES